MKNFLLSFYEKIIDAQGFLFYIILSNYVGPFCSVEINTTTFHGLAFTFVRRCIVVKNTFAKQLFGQPNTKTLALFPCGGRALIMPLIIS